MPDDDTPPPRPPMPLAKWRRTSGERRIDAVPAHLCERLATTAERVAITFAFAAQVHARLAERSGAEADHHHARAAWTQLVADFERQQAAALRNRRLLATPWRPVPAAQTRASTEDG
jgi:hypothetical protein